MGTPKKKLLNALFFVAIMAITFYIFLRGQSPQELWMNLRQLKPSFLLLSIAMAVFFVGMEGIMIWYLNRSLKGNSSLWRCIGYSFIGFFYSGITPSATGGQPMQLYKMKKDGNSLSDSTVVLMTIALIYKLVLVFLGLGILLFWFRGLRESLGGYFYLYLLGLFLNVLLVLLILLVMLKPTLVLNLFSKIERSFVRIKLLKPSERRSKGLYQFVKNYHAAVDYLTGHKKKIFIVIFLTFLQRVSVFALTYIIYRGFGLSEYGLGKVMTLQAAVYIAVDMLPVPGAQGITELMYKSIFLSVFTSKYLMPSLCVTRGINFYFLLILGMLVVLGDGLYSKMKTEIKQNKRYRLTSEKESTILLKED